MGKPALLRVFTAKAAAKEIRHLDKERPAITVQPRFQLSGKWIESAPINVVVVANIESGARIRRPAKQELAFHIRSQRIKIDSSANKNEARELVGRLERHKVLVKCYESGVVSSQPLLGKIEIEVERRQRLIINVCVHAEDSAGSGIKRRITDSGRGSRVAQTRDCGL